MRPSIPHFAGTSLLRFTFRAEAISGHGFASMDHSSHSKGVRKSPWTGTRWRSERNLTTSPGYFLLSETMDERSGTLKELSFPTLDNQRQGSTFGCCGRALGAGCRSRMKKEGPYSTRINRTQQKMLREVRLTVAAGADRQHPLELALLTELADLLVKMGMDSRVYPAIDPPCPVQKQRTPAVRNQPSSRHR